MEAQISALVELHDAAAAELESSRTKLAEAEAATASAASVALPPEHYWSAVSADPGVFWTAFKAVISQRCPGMPEGLVGQLDAATKAFEAALTPMFARPANATIEAGQAPAAGSPQAPPAPPMPEGNGSGNQPTAPAAVPTDVANGGGNGTGVLTGSPSPVLAPHGNLEPREFPMQEHQHAAAVQQAAAAAATAQQRAEHVRQQQAQQQQQLLLQQQKAAAAAAAAAAEAASVVPVDGGGNGSLVDPELGDGTSNHSDANANDSMGGGAADGVANKRSFDAVTAAKAIAAKAKAKSAPH